MLTFKDDDFRHQIEEETGVRPEWRPIFRGTRPGRAAEHRPIKASPFIPHKDSVRGFVSDVTNGHLREVA